MRKDKLIALLQSIKGNPDIVLWNGMVGDWMDVSPKLVDHSLVKISFDHYVKTVEFEEKRNRNDWDHKLSNAEVEKLKRSYQKHYGWEMNEFVTTDDVKEGRYKEKQVVIINAKPRGVKTWDRLGDIEY